MLLARRIPSKTNNNNTDEETVNMSAGERRHYKHSPPIDHPHSRGANIGTELMPLMLLTTTWYLDHPSIEECNRDATALLTTHAEEFPVI